MHARRLDEGLEILKGLWSGEPFAFEGEHYKIRETGFLPTPVQRPHPPVWVAAHLPDNRLAPRPLRRAARWDGVFPELVKGGRVTPARIAELLGYITKHRPAMGTFDVVIGGRSADCPKVSWKNIGVPESPGGWKALPRKCHLTTSGLESSEDQNSVADR